VQVGEVDAVEEAAENGDAQQPERPGPAGPEPGQEGGRVLQKARTRDALVAATRQLMRAGVTPAVEQAADVTRVSRTTAYRYFSSQRALLAATFPHLEGCSLLGDDPPADVRARVVLFAEKMTQSILANEAEMRGPCSAYHSSRRCRCTRWRSGRVSARYGSPMRLPAARLADGNALRVVDLRDRRGDRHRELRLARRCRQRRQTTAAAILKSSCAARTRAVRVKLWPRYRTEPECASSADAVSPGKPSGKSRVSGFTAPRHLLRVQ